MFTPVIGPTTSTSAIDAQIAQALSEGLTVRLGRFTARPTGGGSVAFTRFSEDSRSGPLNAPEPMGSACPEGQAAHSLLQHWKGDW